MKNPLQQQRVSETTMMNHTNGWWTLNPPQSKPTPEQPTMQAPQKWTLEPIKTKTKRSEYRAAATHR